MKTLHTLEIAKRINEETGLPKLHVQFMLRALAALVEDEIMKGNSVSLLHLGTFCPIHVKKRPMPPGFFGIPKDVREGTRLSFRVNKHTRERIKDATSRANREST